MSDHVTFTLTLPIHGLFDESLRALRQARDAQVRLGNPEAARALHTVCLLAEAGNLALMTSVKAPAF